MVEMRLRYNRVTYTHMEEVSFGEKKNNRLYFSNSDGDVIKFDHLEAIKIRDFLNREVS